MHWGLLRALSWLDVEGRKENKNKTQKQNKMETTKEWEEWNTNGYYKCNVVQSRQEVI